MFEKIKYKLNSLDTLCKKYLDEKENERNGVYNNKDRTIFYNSILEKFYKEYKELDGLIDVDFIDFLNKSNEISKELEQEKKYDFFTKIKIIENIKIDKISKYLDEKMEDLEFKYKNGNMVLTHLISNGIDIENYYKKIYDFYFKNEIDKYKKINLSSEFKLEIFEYIFLLGRRDIINKIVDNDFYLNVNQFVKDKIENKNISERDINFLKKFEYKLKNNKLEKNIIDLYNNIEFKKIGSNHYDDLLKSNFTSKELFDNIVKNYNLKNNKIGKVIELIEKSQYKDDFKELLNNLKEIKKEQDIKNKRTQDNLTNVLLGTLIAGAMLSKNNNIDNSNSLIDTAVDIGIGVAIGDISDNIFN